MVSLPEGFSKLGQYFNVKSHGRSFGRKTTTLFSGINKPLKIKPKLNLLSYSSGRVNAITSDYSVVYFRESDRIMSG